MQNHQFHFLLILIFFSCSTFPTFSWSQNQQYNQAKNYEGSSDLLDLEYHMGPILSNPINIYVIWYGHWNPSHQSTIRDFLLSFSPRAASTRPSVSDWWRTVQLYTDQTGSNITNDVVLSGEFHDFKYSHGMYLTRLDMQSVIKSATTSSNSPRKPLPMNYRDGVYLILTSDDVQVQDFCRAVCGFHYFTFPSIVGVTVPYAWVGNSGRQCPGMCAYPFAWPKYSGKPPPGTNGGNRLMGAPNGDAGTDGMISVIAHELAEVSSNPFVNAWYAGDDPSAPTEIADLCLGVYGSGGGGGYAGVVYKDLWGNGFNLNGVNGRKFLVQWVWNPLMKRCFGPNALE